VLLLRPLRSAFGWKRVEARRRLALLGTVDGRQSMNMISLIRVDRLLLLVLLLRQMLLWMLLLWVMRTRLAARLRLGFGLWARMMRAVVWLWLRLSARSLVVRDATGGFNSDDSVSFVRGSSSERFERDMHAICVRSSLNSLEVVRLRSLAIMMHC
jgi:hypothetical protein